MWSVTEALERLSWAEEMSLDDRGGRSNLRHRKVASGHKKQTKVKDVISVNEMAKSRCV